jgi:hypothetical protein
MHITEEVWYGLSMMGRGMGCIPERAYHVRGAVRFIDDDGRRDGMHAQACISQERCSAVYK